MRILDTAEGVNGGVIVRSESLATCGFNHKAEADRRAKGEGGEGGLLVVSEAEWTLKAVVGCSWRAAE